MDHPVKVWLGGEGPSEIGDRDRPDGERVGALEALLRKVEAGGWNVEGATQWVDLRKYEVGAAIGRVDHGDERNVVRLVNRAYEMACEVVAFSRDVDAERRIRADAISRGIARAREVFPMVDIIGGPAYPAIEGWILAMLEVRDTDMMSRDRANELLAERALCGKHAEDYVEVVERADLDRLPPGCEALKAWVATAREVLGRAIRGTKGAEV